MLVTDSVLLPALAELNLPKMSSTSSGTSSVAFIEKQQQQRKIDFWTNEERWIFMETVLQNGRDFNLITEKLKTKIKEQVRQYYYRTLGEWEWH